MSSGASAGIDNWVRWVTYVPLTYTFWSVSSGTSASRYSTNRL